MAHDGAADAPEDDEAAATPAAVASVDEVSTQDATAQDGTVEGGAATPMEDDAVEDPAP